MAFLQLVYLVPIWITCCLPNYAFSTQSQQTVTAPHYDFPHHPANVSHSDLLQHPVNASYNDLLQHPANASDFILIDSPCPNAEDIAPCECEYIEGTGMSMYCSDIADENQLYDIFHSFIPFSQFSSLYLDTSNVESLSANVFGNATFEKVFADNGILKYVDSETFIKSISKLVSITLTDNDLVTFPFDTIKQYTKISYLILGGNPINIFPIIESPTLKVLYLDSSLIEEIPVGALNSLPNLLTLNLYGTQITSFPILESQTLTQLDLGLTQISIIPNSAIDYLPSLLALSLSVTPISSFPILKSQTLTNLDLHRTLINTIPVLALAGLPNFLALNLYGCQLSDFPILESQTLTTLNVGHTLINTIPDGAIDGLPSLSELNLCFNPISNFPILASQSLTTLNIGSTPINTIPEGAFDGLPNLQDIQADNTKLDTMASGLFTSLRYLKYIDLHYGKLTHLQSCQFELNMNCHLGYPIALYDNEISVVDIDTFKGIQSGTIIDLVNNLLSILPEATWRPVIDAGVYLLLRDNDFTCECDVAWIVLEPNYHQYFPDARCLSGELIWSLDPGLYEHCRTVVNETSAQHN